MTDIRMHSVALAMALGLLASGACAADAPKGPGGGFESGKLIHRQYIAPLGLRGKNASEVIATMLAEGFRCGLEHADRFGLDVPPLAHCERVPSGFGDSCRELNVDLNFERDVAIVSQAALLARLDVVKVTSVFSSCFSGRKASVEFAAARSVGEETLAHWVREFDLAGPARTAYDRLLLEGYLCGFDRDAAAAPELICTTARTRIKYCFQAKLVMDVEWPDRTADANKLYGALGGSQVSSVRSSCEVPAVWQDSDERA